MCLVGGFGWQKAAALLGLHDPELVHKACCKVRFAMLPCVPFFIRGTSSLAPSNFVVLWQAPGQYFGSTFKPHGSWQPFAPQDQDILPTHWLSACLSSSGSYRILGITNGTPFTQDLRIPQLAKYSTCSSGLKYSTLSDDWTSCDQMPPACCRLD